MSNESINIAKYPDGDTWVLESISGPGPVDHRDCCTRSWWSEKNMHSSCRSESSDFQAVIESAASGASLDFIKLQTCSRWLLAQLPPRPRAPARTWSVPNCASNRLILMTSLQRAELGVDYCSVRACVRPSPQGSSKPLVLHHTVSTFRKSLMYSLM